MSLFEFTYWDRHKDQLYNEAGEIYYVPRDNNWYKFKITLDTRETRIKTFNSSVIFEDDGTPIECTEVTLHNDDTYFAVNKLETFKIRYRDVYIPMIDITPETKEEPPTG